MLLKRTRVGAPPLTPCRNRPLSGPVPQCDLALRIYGALQDRLGTTSARNAVDRHAVSASYNDGFYDTECFGCLVRLGCPTAKPSSIWRLAPSPGDRCHVARIDAIPMDWWRSPMKVFLGIALLSLIAPSILAQSPGSHSPEAAIEGSSYVDRAANAIRAERKRDPRVNTAKQLTQWVRKNPGQVSDADIFILAGLLRDDDDIIRGEAAGSLGFLGKRAEPAIPQLLDALKERPCVSQPAMSADAIHVALERIGYGPMGFPCVGPRAPLYDQE